jgi:hypothetical protein
MRLVSVPVPLVLVLTWVLPPEEASAEQAEVAAASRFDQGVELYRAGDLTQALEEFQGAYDLEPNPLVLFNIGQVQYELGQLAAASVSFERYLTDGGDAISEERRSLVERRLRRLREELGPVAVEAVDEVQVAPTPSLADAERESALPTETPGPTESASLPEQLTPAALATVPELLTPTSPVALSAPMVAPQPDRPRSRLLWAAAGTTTLSVALLSTTLGLYIWNDQRDTQWQAEAQSLAGQWPKTTHDDGTLRERLEANQELGSELRAWGVAEWVMLGVGLATAGVAVALWLLRWRSR